MSSIPSSLDCEEIYCLAVPLVQRVIKYIFQQSHQSRQREVILSMSPNKLEDENIYVMSSSKRMSKKRMREEMGLYDAPLISTLLLSSNITINQTVDYMARGFIIIMQGVDITWAIGRVVFKVSPVLCPNRTCCCSCNFRAQNRLDFQWLI